MAEAESTFDFGGLMRVPRTSIKLEDVDEEIFLLYTRLAGKSVADGSEPFAGLGYVDSRTPIIKVNFELVRPGHNLELPTSKGTRRRKAPKIVRENNVNFEIQLAQDTTALRSRKGDTGSVLWRLSVHFAKMVLEQHLFDRNNALLDYDALKNAHVLELGAGIGLLSIVFSPLVRTYKATDIPELVPLMLKNLALNGDRPNITAEELDWLQLSSATPSHRSKIFAYPTIDLLLVVDCIYHPSLLPALVETINHLSTTNKTVVLVAVELRAEDVLEEFLRLWVGQEGRWEIWSISEGLIDASYAMWVGMKKTRAAEI